jgi:ISXO2-like transposase domain
MYAHETVDHAEKYVDGRAHTNGLENFWSLLKRGLNGTYISVQPSTCSATWTSGCSPTTCAK